MSQKPRSHDRTLRTRVQGHADRSRAAGKGYLVLLKLWLWLRLTLVEAPCCTRLLADHDDDCPPCRAQTGMKGHDQSWRGRCGVGPRTGSAAQPAVNAWPRGVDPLQAQLDAPRQSAGARALPCAPTQKAYPCRSTASAGINPRLTGSEIGALIERDPDNAEQYRRPLRACSTGGRFWLRIDNKENPHDQHRCAPRRHELQPYRPRWLRDHFRVLICRQRFASTPRARRYRPGPNIRG